MAFSYNGFQYGRGGNNAPAFHQYGTSDTFATVEGDGYFDEIARNLKTGDTLRVYSSATGVEATREYQITQTTNTDVALGSPSGFGIFYLQVTIPDISTASSTFVRCPVAGKVVSIDSVISGAITVGAANLSFEINGTAITDGGIVVAVSGSGIGVEDSATPTAANTVAKGDLIEAITDGASTDASAGAVTLTIDLT